MEKKQSSFGAYTLLLALLVVAVLSGLFAGGGLGEGSNLSDTFLKLRSLRIVAAGVAGASLAVGGAAVQGLFRNPLASPSILGTTAGASLGGQLALLASQSVLFGGAFSILRPDMWMPIGSVIGALLALALLLVFIRHGSDILTLLLVGFILSSLFLSFGSFITSLAQESWSLGRAMVSWSLGNVGGSGVAQVLFTAPLFIVGSLALFVWGPALDLLLSGEEEASTLGLNVIQVRRWVVVWVAVLTGAAVSLGGGVAFVGLVVPHLMRSVVGVRHRALIPACALCGCAFLIACDAIARIMPGQSEVPLGVVTGLIGAPIFLYLLLRYERGVAYV